MQHEVRNKISLMPEDAPGGNTDTEPDTRIYLLIYKFGLISDLSRTH